mmetsp:Transcript_30000/g.76294  ORF Transcript_30000/g.76294 Transcript_30000/m.76294 type:complete len:188 (+) Transcript_30000:44-607(+)
MAAAALAAEEAAEEEFQVEAKAPERPLVQQKGPPIEQIAAWVSSNLLHRERYMMVEPGRLYFHGVPHGVDQRVHEMLQVIPGSRDDHCVRHSFLHQVQAMVRRCGYDNTDECSGEVHMYINHFPCVSCIAIFSQFVRFFPGVRLALDFDNMEPTSFGAALEARKPNALKVEEVMGRPRRGLDYEVHR